MKILVREPGFELMTPKEHIADFPGLIELAGRNCYKSEEKMTPESASAFVRRIIRSGHHSVLEHCVIMVRIICDRACSHQLVRHRLAAYSQESQRYCNYGRVDALQIICPPSIAEAEGVEQGLYEVEFTQNKNWWQVKEGPTFFDVKPSMWFNSICEAYAAYSNLVAAKIKAEDARTVLPNATKTEVVSTFNLRMWRHIFEERAHNPHAQWQIRGIMLDIFHLFCELLPDFFEDMKVKK